MILVVAESSVRGGELPIVTESIVAKLDAVTFSDGVVIVKSQCQRVAPFTTKMTKRTG